jgi:Contractile injection system tube protein
MERVAFLVDKTGERIDCMLNPESVTMTRLTGVRARGTASGQLTGTGLADDPLQFTGGGRTELTLDLLFDIDFVNEQNRPADVRALTNKLRMLAENSQEELGNYRPPLVRLVWCKSWNVPCVITALAERFDAFGVEGRPRRSWLRMKMVRVAESAAEAALSYEEELERTANDAAGSPVELGGAKDAVQAVGEGNTDPGYSGVRFDLLATDALGNPFQWRQLAEHNDIDDPFHVQPGQVLAVPPGLPGPQGGNGR